MKKFLATVFILIIIYFLLPEHVQMGLKHNFADVDDYKIFPSHTVAHAQPQPWTVSRNYNKIRPSNELLKMMEDRQTCAYLVIKDGQIVFENYWEQYNKETISGSFSMAKTVNALLIGKLLQLGLIHSLDDDVKQYVPELTQISAGALTIRDVLMMSADIDWHESYMNPFSLTAESYYGNDLAKLMKKLKLRDTHLQGKRYEYQSCCTQILGYIIRNTTHKSLAENLQEYFWKPMGAESDALWSTDKNGIEKSFCCINATARDFARLGKLVLHHGTWNNTSIVDSNYIAQMTTPDTQLKDEGGHMCDWYGYQMWIINYKGHRIPFFRGILGQFIFIIPDENMVIVRLGKKIKRNTHDFRSMNDDIRNYIEAGLQVVEKVGN